MGKILFFLIFSVHTQAWAFHLETYGVGYGLMSSGLFTESVTSDGKTSLYGSFSFHFLTGHLRWTDDTFKYGVRMGYTMIPRETADGAAKVTQLLISPQFGVPFGGSRQFLWNTGLSLLRTESKGQGGQVVVNNGSGTAVFYRPSDTSTSLLINLETGVNYQFSGGWFSSADLLFNGLLGDKRNVSLFLSIGYSWGQGVSSSDYGYPSEGRY